MQQSIETAVKSKARLEGFDSVHIGKAQFAPAVSSGLRGYIDAGYHGEMAWMHDTLQRRSSPRAMWPDARSAVIMGLNYAPESDPLERLAQPRLGNISVYAHGRDYHDVIKPRLKRVASWLAKAANAQVKVFVDTAPLMEKPLAAAAGAGWQGKHTNLVSTEFGSWLFLGVILTSASLRPDEAGADRCGSCRACLDICPTKAFPEPYRLDARKCISYLTIEHKGHIPERFLAAVGNRIYGCDDCLAVCPWNKFAKRGNEMRLKVREDVAWPDLAELAALDDAAFRKLFAKSPVKRIGRDRFVRNVLIAIANGQDRSMIACAERLIHDPAAIVRAMAVRALARLMDLDEFVELRGRCARNESDQAVRVQWFTAR